MGAVSVSNDLPLTGLEVPAMAAGSLLYPPPLDFLPPGMSHCPRCECTCQCRQPGLRRGYGQWGQSGSETRFSNVSRGSGEVWWSWGCLRGAASPWPCSVTNHTSSEPRQVLCCSGRTRSGMKAGPQSMLVSPLLVLK